jgi:hypothetical protein
MVEVNSIKQPVTEITEETFDEMLCVLPPENWNALPGGGQFFQLMEYYSENVTSYYVEVANSEDSEYFTFRDKAWLKPKEVRQKIESFLQNKSTV